MIENILLVGTQVVILFILIAIGVVCNKTKILTSKSLKDITNLVLYIITPCVIINSYNREFDLSMLKGLLITIIATLLSFAANILIAHLVIKDSDKKREAVLRFGAVFSNCGYMSLPLQQALLGDEGVFYCATYVAIFQIMLWTYGIIVISGDIKNLNPKKMILNPGVLSTLIGIIIFILPITLPKIIIEPVKYLAALNTPLPMIIIGFYLATSSFNIKGFNIYLSFFLRLIASPILMLIIVYAFGIRGSLLVSSVISASAPVAAVSTMFSEKFNSDTPLSATMVSISTVLSILTMPLIIGFTMMLA